MTIFKPSIKQQAIFNEWDNADNNILINAVAGSGKTTTLLQLVEKCQYKTLFLAFNRSVQQEIQERIESKGLKQGKAMTMHSLGLLSIRSQYKVNVNKYKGFEMVKFMQEKYKKDFKKYPWKDRLRISYTLMDMNDMSRIFLTDDLEQIIKCFASMNKILFQFDEMSNMWKKFLEIREDSYQKNKIDIDFIDMIYLPVKKEMYIPIDPYYLMIDEAQDLNLCQHKMIDLMLSQGDIRKWIAVGDRNQSIYGFSGADTSSFDKFLEKGNVSELPLDICYRCSSSIIEMANKVYPVIEGFKEDEGIVGTLVDTTLIKDSSMVICRNSGPLISLYFSLIGESRSCYLKGDDIMNSILRFAKPYSYSSIGQAKVEMQAAYVQLGKDNSEKGRIKYHVFTQNYENFKKLAEHLCEKGSDKVSTLIEKVKDIFTNKGNAITLCTIHKSKGLEAEVVYILNEHLIPSPFAVTEEQLKQEQNLKYVARTRAKKELYFLNI